MEDLFAGSQNYLGLKGRLLRQLGVTVWEVAASCWRPRTADSLTDSNAPRQVPSAL